MNVFLVYEVNTEVLNFSVINFLGKSLLDGQENKSHLKVTRYSKQTMLDYMSILSLIIEPPHDNE